MNSNQSIDCDGLRVGSDDLERQSRLLAGFLTDEGLGANSVVALLMFNDIPYFSLAAACRMIGAYLVPLNWHLTRAELDYILEDCGARILFGHGDLLANAGFESQVGLTVVSRPTPSDCVAAYPKLASGRQPARSRQWKEVLADARPFAGTPVREHRGGIFYTSGTTGRPKGVVRQPLAPEVWKTITARSRTGFGLDDIRQGDVSVVAGPLYHSAPNAHAAICREAGASLVLMPRFDPAAFIALSDACGMTHVHMVPTMFSRLLALPEETRKSWRHDRLKAICHGAAPCPPEVKRAMIDWIGPSIREYYAGTETGIIATASSQEWMQRPGTVGRAAEGVDIRVIDERGGECGRGETGWLIAHSNSTTSFLYHGRAASPHVDGWPGYVSLGDIGHQDAEGYVFLTDRSADIVISGGVNIYPAEIEMELTALDGVGDCAVIGVPLSDLGEAVIAIVEPKEGKVLSEAALLAALSVRLAGFKLPRRMVFVDRLPREDSGKIRKRLLKSEYETIFRNGETNP